MNITSRYKIQFVGITNVVIMGALVLVAFLSNGIYLLACLATIYLVMMLLWRSHRPGILVFAFVMQWTQIAAYVVWMNVMGKDINFLSPHAGIAVLMSCLGVLVMALVLSQRVNSLPIPSSEQLSAQAKLINEKKMLMLYLFSTFFLGGIGFILGPSSGFAQILITLSSLKWAFFLVYAFVCWINKKNRVLLIVIILFEFTTSLYSYFSSFKEVILMTILLALTFVRRISFRQFMNGFLTALVLGFLLLTWTAIKNDYRQFLNGGTRKQVVGVSRSEAFSKIEEKVGTLSVEDYQNAGMLFLYRLQYIYHLAKTMDRVPEVLPYEYGAVWWGNITFVLEPRLLFPDKPIYEATVKTNKYTGIRYAGFKLGSSFSLGYFADSYIDFGFVGMVIPLALIGFFVSLIYRSLYRLKGLNLLIRYALINVALFEFGSFEADGLFLFGRLLLTILVFYTLAKTVLPPLQRWLYKA
ncbi:MAG TPA: hypothetical protein VKQ52_20165 [Puia sp.]|nr:hypothetical protein [Puia sp.]